MSKQFNVPKKKTFFKERQLFEGKFSYTEQAWDI